MLNSYDKSPTNYQNSPGSIRDISEMTPAQTLAHIQALEQKISDQSSQIETLSQREEEQSQAGVESFQLLLYRTAQIMELRKILIICMGKEKANEYFELLPKFASGTYHMLRDDHDRLAFPELPSKPNFNIA
ncbi:MAG: hypothetical protein AAFQ92_22620 [Bacteroidota bacterium]